MRLSLITKRVDKVDRTPHSEALLSLLIKKQILTASSVFSVAKVTPEIVFSIGLLVSPLVHNTLSSIDFDLQSTLIINQL